MAQNPTPPILDLDAIVAQRPQIRLRGKLYDLLASEDLGPQQALHLQRLWREYQDGASNPNLEDLDLVKLEQNLRDQLVVISPEQPPIHLLDNFHGMPAEVINSLSFQDLIVVTDFFIDQTGLTQGFNPKFQMAVERLHSRTGPSSSPSSSDSTVPETPRAG